MLSQFLPTNGEDFGDAATRHMVVVNDLKMPAHKVGESSSEVRAVGLEAAPRGGSIGKGALSHYDKAISFGDNPTMASGRCRDPLSQSNSEVDLFHARNAKRGGEERDLLEKLIAKVLAAARSILPARSEATISSSI